VDRRALLLVLLSLGCSRNKAESAPDAAPPPPPEPSAVPAPVVTNAAATARPSVNVLPVEARRSRVSKLEEDPALLANADTLRKHFGGAIPSGLVVQTAVLTMPGRVALLVADGGKTGTSQDQPIVLVLDDANKLLWSKERPAGGIMPPVGKIAIAAGPKGRVALAICDAPTSSVALREWDEESTAFADFQAMDADGCDDVSVLYWAKRGWVIAAARKDGVRAQLVSSDGRLEWGRGIPLGARWRAASPASLAADSDDTFLLAQYAGQDQDHALVYRYDAKGAPVWPNGVDLGELPRVPAGQEHVGLSIARDRPGIVHVKLASKELDVASSGEIVKGR